MFLATSILIVAFVYFFRREIYFLFRRKTSPQSNEGTVILPALSDTGYILLYQNTLRKSTLEQRAAPNQRLVQVFGIDNAFTTIDKAYYNAFVADTRAKLKTTSDEWKLLAQAVDTCIGCYLVRDEDAAGSVNLVNLVQTIVFKAVMFKFFPEHRMPSDIDIRSITTKINDLWISSKDDAYLTSGSSVQDRLDLDTILREFFGAQQDEPLGGRNNPLNIILPAYETLWRIVLRLSLEIRFRGVTDIEHPRRMQVLTTFLIQPDSSLDFYDLARLTEETQDTLDRSHAPRLPMLPSMRDIVNEGLRLYPPTRRIYRQVGGEKIAVDVEALHRDVNFWGNDALEFRPSRFMGFKPRTLQFLPFGSGVFECPAKGSFGPIMIGIIVASLAMNIGEGYRLSGCGAEEVMADREPLCNGRNALKGLCIEKLPNSRLGK